MSDTHIDVRTSAVLAPCGAADHEDCGLRLVLDRLGEQWTVMVLAELSEGSRRYRELERALDGISQRMLTLTVRKLERDGHVLRHVEPTVPPRVTYTLSELGRSFAAQISSMVLWSRQNRVAIEDARTRFDTEGAR